MIKTRPISFSDPMVAALLADQKGVTRRLPVVTPHVRQYLEEKWGDATPTPGYLNTIAGNASRRQIGQGLGISRFGKVGDILRVREAHTFCDVNDNKGESWVEVKYRVNNLSSILMTCSVPEAEKAWAWVEEKEATGDGGDNWRSARAMPRYASRIFLRITALDVERLQDITPGECLLEGVHFVTGTGFCVNGMFFGNTERQAFMNLWNSIHGEEIGHCWEDNPLVEVIRFDTLHIVDHDSDDAFDYNTFLSNLLKGDTER